MVSNDPAPMSSPVRTLPACKSSSCCSMVTISPWGMITDSVSLPPSGKLHLLRARGSPFRLPSLARRYLCPLVGAFGTGEPGWRLFEYGWHADSEAAMKTVLLADSSLLWRIHSDVDPGIGAEKLRLDLNPATATRARGNSCGAGRHAQCHRYVACLA